MDGRRDGRMDGERGSVGQRPRMGEGMAGDTAGEESRLSSVRRQES